MADKDVIKRAMIAGAASAMNYKERHPKATESEVMSHVSKEMTRLIDEIEGD